MQGCPRKALSSIVKVNNFFLLDSKKEVSMSTRMQEAGMILAENFY
jgi:hypothetical protein